MNRKPTIVAIVALIIGLLIGYLFWGYQGKQLETALAAAKADLAAAEKSRVPGEALAAKVKGLEEQLKQVTESLAKEKELREKAQAKLSKGKK